MKALVMTTLMALGLTGGVAAADTYHGDGRRDEARDHRGDRDGHFDAYRDGHHRPAPRVERHEERRGYRWIGGEWRWSGAAWGWTPGHYARARRW